MSPRKKLCTPRSSSNEDHKQLQEKDHSLHCNLRNNDKQQKPKHQISSDRSIPTLSVKNKSGKQAPNSLLENSKKTKNTEINVTKSSELLESNELKSDNANLQVYTVYTKDVMLKKMSPLLPKPDVPVLEPIVETNVQEVSLQFPSVDLTKEIWRESIVWKYFTNVQGGAGCKFCNRLLKIARRGSVSLEHHLFMRHRQEYDYFQQECVKGIGGVTSTMKEPLKTYSRVRKPLQLEGSKPVSPINVPIKTEPVEPEHKLNLEHKLDMNTSDTKEDSQKALPDLISKELLEIENNKDQLIGLYNFGTFKKKSPSILENASTGTSSATKTLSDFVRKPSDSILHDRKVSDSNRVQREKYRRDDHAYAILECFDKLRASPVKPEPVETPDVVTKIDIPESMDIIVPDPVSVPHYPIWIKKEPESLATTKQSECPKSGSSEQTSPLQQVVLAQKIKTEPKEEEILGLNLQNTNDQIISKPRVKKKRSTQAVNVQPKNSRNIKKKEISVSETSELGPIRTRGQKLKLQSTNDQIISTSHVENERDAQAVNVQPKNSRNVRKKEISITETSELGPVQTSGQNAQLQNSNDQSISVPRVKKETGREAAKVQAKNFRKVKNKEIKIRRRSERLKLGRPNFQFYSTYKKDRLKKMTPHQPKHKRTAALMSKKK